MEKENYNIKNHFAACVILYNPKKEDIENIATYKDKVTKVYVFDNTESHSNKDLFKGIENIDYFWDGENKGLSVRLNQACQNAMADNFEYLLTMDQDSSFLEENITTYLSNILTYREKEKVAVYGLEYKNVNVNVSKDTISIEKKDHLITSASVLNLQLYQTIGGFDENLFIDGVDIDYCYASMVKGYDNIQFKNNYFKHALGEPVRKGSITSFYLLKKNVRIHSPIRVYYMKRNILYLEQKYGSVFPEYIKKQKEIYKRHIRRCIKYSDTFLQTLTLRNRAISDFKNKKMGKLVL